MRLIVTSQQDIAGSNVYAELRDIFSKHGEFEGKPILRKGGVWLIATEKPLPSASHLDEYFDAEYYVFASRHRSKSRERTLTVHAPGNLGERADVGGRPRELAYVNADAMKVALTELEKYRAEHSLDYRVSLEATHHGPTELKKPVLFVEVGSTKNEWEDDEAVSAVAGAALAAAENTRSFEKAICIGGSHYAPLHTRLALGSDIALGHVIPSHAIDSLTVDVLRSAVERTKASFGYLDWKGMKAGGRSKVAALAFELGLALKRGRDIEKRLGLEYREYSMPEALLAEAERIDAAEVERVVEAYGAIIKRSADGRVTNRFLAKEDVSMELRRACIEILRKKYTVIEEADRLILRSTKFDVAKAAALHLKPGPLYSELAKGKSVQIDGRVVTPEMVSIKVEKVLYLNV